jgi:hypothetical protein
VSISLAVMAPMGRAAVAGVIRMALGIWLLAAGVAQAQPSGAQPSSARSLWSRALGTRQFEYDRAAVRALFEGPGASVREFSSFRRHGRRFVHVRLDVADIRRLTQVPSLAWSRYRLDRTDTDYHFVQDVGPPQGKSPGDVGWTGSELVAFRLHLPSKINFHNSPDGVERGNVLAWEQPLRERLNGTPLHLEARMTTQSILYRTLWLFGATFTAAMGVLALFVWWIRSKGRGGVGG